MLAFLQSWRAAIIPLLAVPVAVLGAFAVMAGMGFSLNNISLFGLVLAIVVVENVERWMARDARSAERRPGRFGRRTRPRKRTRRRE